MNCGEGGYQVEGGIKQGVLTFSSMAWREYHFLVRVPLFSMSSPKTMLGYSLENQCKELFSLSGLVGGISSLILQPMGFWFLVLPNTFLASLLVLGPPLQSYHGGFTSLLPYSSHGGFLGVFRLSQMLMQNLFTQKKLVSLFPLAQVLEP